MGKKNRQTDKFFYTIYRGVQIFISVQFASSLLSSLDEKTFFYFVAQFSKTTLKSPFKNGKQHISKEYRKQLASLVDRVQLTS